MSGVLAQKGTKQTAALDGAFQVLHIQRKGG